MRLMEEEKYVREKKMIRCRPLYDAPATFMLAHGGRPITLSHPRRSPRKVDIHIRPVCFVFS
jgi:hypothetical protein